MEPHRSHHWKPTVFTTPTWCSVCGEFFWLPGLVCQTCGLLSHPECKVAASSCMMRADPSVSSVGQRFLNVSRMADSIVSTLSPEVDRKDPEHGNVYRIHYNTIVGGVRSMEQERSARFPTISIQMHFVPDILGLKMSTWNRDYEAAQQIFGPGPACMLARASIKLLHAQLYRRGSNLRTKKGVVKSGSDFLSMIGYGVRGGRERFFTYVLKEDKMFFCETGQEFFRDFTSKHAMHANCDEDVRYSGEFHVLKNKHGDHVLYVDNNSGTYSPEKKDLPLIAEIFRKKLPGS
eukprot:TRINITY_DN5897_c0_g2_i2.p1 TRINITY_DN5897_c0_g2~~TRINITY_DN5897_c0_g2_i2.p1  ORF type:complete len:291 (-),score=16.70 TRINITY_DN5897_c0_g2_i2:349-1221(-)